MFYTLNQRPRQAPIQDSNSTLKPQLRANRESVAKHQQVNTPEQATHLRQLLATENRPSQELEWILRRKRVRKSPCKISEIRPTRSQCQAGSLPARLISNVPRTPPQASPL